MSLATIRSLLERELTAEFAPLTVVYDNVQETPPQGADSEFVVLAISFPSLTTPTLCPKESGLDDIRGNVQISCYAPRARGMKRLEELGVKAAVALNTLQSKPDPDNVRIRIGQINGPVPVLSGSDPHALVTVSAPFTAKG